MDRAMCLATGDGRMHGWHHNNKDDNGHDDDVPSSSASTDSPASSSSIVAQKESRRSRRRVMFAAGTADDPEFNTRDKRLQKQERHLRRRMERKAHQHREYMARMYGVCVIRGKSHDLDDDLDYEQLVHDHMGS